MLLMLCSTEDGDNVINKKLNDVVYFDINFKSTTNLTNPDLIMRRIGGVDYDGYNYLHIPELERYYFIRHVIALSNNFFKLVCECDYLESFKDDILNSDASYKKSMVSTDLGALKLDSTGREEISNYFGGVEMVSADNTILSVLRWKR